MADRNWKLETWRDEPRTWMLHDEGYATSIDGPDKDGDLCVEIDEHGYGTIRSYVPVAQVASLLRAMGWSVSAPPAPSPPETPAPEESEEKRERYIDAVERVVKALAAGERPKCRTCKRPAVCVGAYEESENLDFACDECCGHGNKDGWCVTLETPGGVPCAECGRAVPGVLSSTMPVICGDCSEPASPASAPRETPGLPTPMPREERVGLVPDAEERLARLGRLAAATIAQPDPVKMAEGRGWVRGYADGLAEGLSRAVRTAPPESPASAASPEKPRRLYRYCPGTDHPMAPSYCATTPHDECESLGWTPEQGGTEG